MPKDKNSILLERLKNNDQQALKTIFDEHYPTVYKAIYRLVNDQGISQELAQNVFIQFWEKRHKIQITGVLGAYLRRMGINQALEQLRRKKHEIREISEADSGITTSAEDIYMDGELQAQINKAVETLPDRCKTVFVLSRFEQLSHKEIGQKLNISPKTVENQISIALKSLKKLLRNYLQSFLFFF